MKVLLIEDDRDVCASLEAQLPKHGFTIDAVEQGNDALEMLREHSYDLLIVDLHLPDMSGEAIVQHVHQLEVIPPVLMLTGDTDGETKVRLLNSGADDYVVKPYSLDELVARMRALLRRPQQVVPETLTFEDVVFDTAKQTVTRDGKAISLTRIERSLLEYLLRNKGKVVEKQVLIEHVWQSSSDAFSNSINTHMSNARKKLGEPVVIETVFGTGYRVG